MTFTYTPATPNDITRARFHLGDTVEAAAIFSDEEITFAIDESDGAWKAAVVLLIESVIARLATEPDMTADWLRVDWRRSAENWRALLLDKKRRFTNFVVGSSGGKHAWRPDSLLHTEPDYLRQWPLNDWCDDD
jgi:hypothetical protein